MSGGQALAATVFDWLTETTWQVAVLVLAVALAQRLLRRWLTPQWAYALWMLVAVRLLLPALPESPVSVFNVTAAADPRAVVELVSETPAPPARAVVPHDTATALEARDGSNGSNGSGTTAEPEDGAEPAVPAVTRPAPTRSRPGPVQLALPGQAEQPDGVPPAMATGLPPSAPTPWEGVLVGVWLLGAAFVGLRSLVRERRFARTIRSLEPLRDVRVLALLEESRERAGVTRSVEVVVTEAVRTPALTGLRRPRILLPPQLLATLSDEQLGFVFRHELAHLRCGDGYVNWVLALLSALHWFDPFVWLAFARLRAHRESARDWEALRSAGGDARAAYGRTLIQLLETGARTPLRSPALGIAESREDMRRRITMITKFTHSKRRGLLVGALAALLIAGPTLTGVLRTQAPQGVPGTSALAEDPPEAMGAAARAEGLMQVRVERRRRPEDWELRIESQLRARLPLAEVNGKAVPVVIGALREASGVNVVVSDSVRENHEHDGVEFPPVAEVDGRLVLETLRRSFSIESCLTGQALFLGESHELPTHLEQRIYDIRPLLDARVRAALSDPVYEGWNEVEVRQQVEDEASDELLNLVLTFGDEESWNREGASIEYWNRLFLSSQTAQVHDTTERFLNLLLNEGRRPAKRTSAWEQSVRSGLSQHVSVAFEETPLREALSTLSESSGVPIATWGDWAEDYTITLTLKDVPASQVLAWIARAGQAHVSFEEPAVGLSQSPQLTIACYRVADLIAPRGGEDQPTGDSLAELVRTSVMPVTWEMYDGVRAVFWGDLMVVAQTDEVHAELKQFLGSLRRALAK